MPLRRTARITISVAASGLALTLAACSPTPAGSESAASSSYPMTIENCGEELQIQSEPESVLTIGSAAISLLDAAGASDRIIARSGEFGADLPADLSEPPTDAEIIDPSDPSTEKIIGAAASVVVGYGLYNSTPEDLAAVDIPNLIIEGECSHDGPSSEPTTFDAVFDDITRLATVFGTTDVASSNVEDLRAELEELESTGGTSEERSAAIVYYFSSSETMSSFGGLAMKSPSISTPTSRPSSTQTPTYSSSATASTARTSTPRRPSSSPSPGPLTSERSRTTWSPACSPPTFRRLPTPSADSAPSSKP